MTLLTEKAETEILKTDVLGRVWTPREKHDDDRLAQAWASKSAELVALELAAYRRKLGG
jgi:hypothetical protein